MEARCLVFGGDGKVAADRCYIPGPGAAEVLIETMLSCISPGTELRVLAGQQPGLGSDSYPLIPGYSLVGRVIARGSAVDAALDGAVVSCAGTAHSNFRHGWGGHVSHAVALAAAVIPVAPTIDQADAVLAPIAGIAQRGVRLAQPQPGETVAVLGLGLIGQLSARLFARTGADVVAGGTAREQVAAAARAGIKAVLVERDSIRSMRKLRPRGANIVVDATGNPAALQLAVELAAEKPWADDSLGGARLVVQGSYPAELAFPHHAAFQKELTVLWPRFSTRTDIVQALSAVENREVRYGDLLSEEVRPDDAPDVYRRLRSDRRGMITAAFRWGPGGDRASSAAPTVEAKPRSSPSFLRGLFGR